MASKKIKKIKSSFFELAVVLLKTAFATLLVITVSLISFSLGQMAVRINYEQTIPKMLSKIATKPTPAATAKPSPMETKKPLEIDTNNNIKPVVYGNLHNPDISIKTEENGALYLYQGQEKLWTTSLILSNPGDYYYDPVSDSLFVIEKFGTWPDGVEKISKINRSDSGYRITELNVSSLDKHSLSKTSIEGLISEDQTLVLKTASGDGCGGGGNIWTLNPTIRENIVSYTFGCSQAQDN